MTHKRTRCHCIGSLSLVALWELEHLELLPVVNRGRWGGAVVGNDAMIVASELNTLGLESSCQLLNPTTADVRVATAVLGHEYVDAVDCVDGPCTRALCLENPAGQRQWIFSRVQKPESPLKIRSTSLVYVDYYPEFYDYFNVYLKSFPKAGTKFIVNISAVNDLHSLPSLTISPFVIQASVSNSWTPNNSADFAILLLRQTSAEIAFVTLGNRGAIMAMGGKAQHLQGGLITEGSQLGAGAFFSAALVAGISKGVDRNSLLEWCVTRAAARIKQQVKKYENYRP